MNQKHFYKPSTFNAAKIFSFHFLKLSSIIVVESFEDVDRLAPSLSRVIQFCEAVQWRHTDYPSRHCSVFTVQCCEDKNILTFCFCLLCHLSNYLLQSWKYNNLLNEISTLTNQKPITRILVTGSGEEVYKINSSEDDSENSCRSYSPKPPFIQVCFFSGRL